MSSMTSFLLGAAVGTAEGAGITYILMKDESEKEEVRANHEDALEMSEEELIAYHVQQLKDLGVDMISGLDVPDDLFNEITSVVNPVEDDEEDYEEEDDEEEDISPIEPNPDPYLIDEDEFDNNDDFSTCTIHYYKKDDVWTDEDLDIIAAPVDLLSVEMVDDIKSSTSKEMYVRVEESCVDYEILIFNDSYAHAVEGEDELGDFADEEEN